MGFRSVGVALDASEGHELAGAAFSGCGQHVSRPPTPQELTVRDPGDLDFGLLARLTSLRQLRVVHGGSVRLSALAR